MRISGICALGLGIRVRLVFQPRPDLFLSIPLNSNVHKNAPLAALPKMQVCFHPRAKSTEPNWNYSPKSAPIPNRYLSAVRVFGGHNIFDEVVINRVVDALALLTVGRVTLAVKCDQNCVF